MFPKLASPVDNKTTCYLSFQSPHGDEFIMSNQVVIISSRFNDLHPGRILLRCNLHENLLESRLTDFSISNAKSIRLVFEKFENGSNLSLSLGFGHQNGILFSDFVKLVCDILMSSISIRLDKLLETLFIISFQHNFASSTIPIRQKFCTSLTY